MIQVRIWAAAFLLATSVQAEFDRFSIKRDHPVCALSQEACDSPVVLNSFYFTKDNGDKLLGNARFLPGSATYRKAGSNNFLTKKADALVINMNRNRALTMNLNMPSKVILIVNFKGFKAKNVSVVSPPGLTLEGSVYAVASDESGVLGFAEQELPGMGIALSTKAGIVSDDDGDLWVAKLPKPSEIKLVGTSAVATGYSVLIVHPETNASFSYPSHPKLSSIRAHTKCPDELHELWTTTSRDTADKDNYMNMDMSSKDNLLKRRTWHPLVDPVYWCSYGHDHGSFPSVLKPAFTHTAWKTEDTTQQNGRQDESDEGFKVFNLNENGLHWIFTVHMELNNPRRFHTRHHTVHVNVYDDEWKMKAELTMKNDFGFAGTRINGKGVKPLNVKQIGIEKELRLAKKRRAFRQFNVRSRTSDCAFEGAIATTPRGLSGKAEHWVAGLNTCSARRGGFKVDVQRPATGLKTCASDAKMLLMDTLRGNSINRAFTSLGRGFQVGRELCSWKKDLPTEVDENGLIKFYTDSYFSRIVTNDEKFRIAQWMAPDFDAKLPPGRYVESDHWHGKFVRKNSMKGKVRGTRNIGGWAVISSEN